LPENEAEKLFDEGYRGSNVGDERGMGHGLHFVRNVVEIHGGRVGFEPKDYGNVFYFILPLKEETSVEQLG
jgi:signal transduction histidine kinase